MLGSLVGFLIILGPLVVVHELGHFLFAKLFGVRADVFSIGFGPRLLQKKWGETLWCVSAIPLGGYVKLLGEDPDQELSPEDRRRALNNAKPWHRFWIFFGGPLFNFIFAIFVFMVILFIGEPKFSHLVARVLEETPAYEAGFRSGDRVMSINGQPIKFYYEIEKIVHESPNRPLTFLVQTVESQEMKTIVFTPSQEEGYSQFAEETSVGKIDGLFPVPRNTSIGVSNPQSVVGKLGMKTGQWVTHFNEKPMEDWEQVEREFLKLAPMTPVKITVSWKDEAKVADEPPITATLTVPPQGVTMGQAWGLHSAELVVDNTVDNSPARKAGLQKGDRLVSVAGKEIVHFFMLRDRIQSLGEAANKEQRPIEVAWERDGKIYSEKVIPTGTQSRDPLLKTKMTYTIGMMPVQTYFEKDRIVDPIYNPLKLVSEATYRMFDITWKNIVLIGKMIVGDVSPKVLGGPILIATVARDSLEAGLISFLTTMALLSVGLGIMNVLPIPVLDGGHILLLAIESIRRRPLSMRQMELVQQVGLGLILLLMVMVFKNDLTRLPIFNN